MLPTNKGKGWKPHASCQLVTKSRFMEKAEHVSPNVLTPTSSVTMAFEVRNGIW